MSLTKTVIVRADEVGGKNIRAFLDGTNHYLQGVTIVDEAGDQSGIGGNPLVMQHGGYLHEEGRGKVSAQSLPLYERPLRVFGCGFHEFFSNRRVSLNIYGYGTTGAGAEKNARAGYNNGTATEGYYAEIDPGTQQGLVEVISRFEAPYVQGVGYFLEGTFKLGHADGLTGHVVYFGFGDFINGAFITFKADGTVAFQTYMNSTLVQNYPGSSWTLPVANPGRYDTNIHRWGLQLDPLTQTVQIWLDGVLVWSYDALQDDTLLPLITTLKPRWIFTARNSAILGASIKHHLYNVAVGMEGIEPCLLGLTRYRMNGGLVTVAAVSTGTALAVLTHNAYQTNNGVKYSYRAARIRHIIISTNKHPSNCTFHLWRGKEVTAYGTKVPVSSPNDATTFTGAATALAAISSGLPANGTGFVGGDTVAYKITAVCSVGETAVYATSAGFVVVAGPTLSVNVTLAAGLYIPEALAYRLYRSVNGGAYQLIATVDPIVFARNGSFTDDAYRANTSVTAPGGAGNTFGDSFCYGNSGTGTTLTASTGRLDHSQQFGDTYSVKLEFEDGELVLLPGENLILAGDNAHATDAAVMNATIEWDENP